jgi:hypothetical protein
LNGKRRWYRADLHLHTPGSRDYEETGVSYLDWLRKVVERGLDIVAITDHNTVAGISAIRTELEWLTRMEQQNRLTPEERARLAEWRELGNKVVVLPGFEFTATFGFHILGIFPPGTPVRQLEHLLLSLKIPANKLDEGSTETGAGTDVLSAYRIIREAGGLVIAAHANSTHGVAMRNFPFGGQTKIAYTQDANLDALEITDFDRAHRSTARFFNGSKNEYARRMHCTQGSDAHRLTMDPRNPKRLGIGDRVTELLLDEPTWENIASVIRSKQFDRVRPAQPQDRGFEALDVVREEGETLTQSFQENASKRGGKLNSVLGDICAFANTAGGSVYVGARAGKGKIKGLENVNETEREIRTELEARITPPLEIRTEVLQSLDAKVLRVSVRKGSDIPYALDGHLFYVRGEGETTLAVRDEIVALVREALGFTAEEIESVEPEFAANDELPEAPELAVSADAGGDEEVVGVAAPAANSDASAGDGRRRRRRRRGGRDRRNGQAVAPVTDVADDIDDLDEEDLEPEFAETPIAYPVEAAPEPEPVQPLPVVAVVDVPVVMETSVAKPVRKRTSRSKKSVETGEAPPLAELAAEPVATEQPVAGMETVAPPPALAVVAEAPAKPTRKRSSRAPKNPEVVTEVAAETAPPVATIPTPEPPAASVAEPAIDSAPEAAIAEAPAKPARKRTAKKGAGGTATVAPEPVAIPAANPAPVMLEAAAPIAQRTSRRRTSKQEPAPAPQPVIALPPVTADDPFYLPQVGVEITSTEVRGGVRHHTIRDLRNGHVVHDVTRKGARKLWSYAIQQKEDHPLNPAKLVWNGNVAMVHKEARAGKVRFDLALRDGDTLRVFYGVTDDGMQGRWEQFLDEDR